MLSAGDRTIMPSRGPSTSTMFANSSVNISNKMAAETQRNQLSQQQANAGKSDAQRGQGENQKQHIWIVTGPAGCGKTTVAVGLAKAFDLPYVEGDDVSNMNHHCFHRLLSGLSGL